MPKRILVALDRCDRVPVSPVRTAEEPRDHLLLCLTGRSDVRRSGGEVPGARVRKRQSPQGGSDGLAAGRVSDGPERLA